MINQVRFKYIFEEVRLVFIVEVNVVKSKDGRRQTGCLGESEVNLSKGLNVEN